MIELIKNPWHWSVAGLLIGLTVPTLLILGNKAFGISSSLRHICAACFPADIGFFKYNWRKESWNLFFAGGVLMGGLVANYFLSNPNQIVIAPATQAALSGLGVKDFSGLLPTDIFNWANLFTIKGLIFFVLGGFMVGFGTRYAGGCTSGHAIMGLSNLQIPSLIATISFMIGGFVATWFLVPFLLQL